MNKQNKVFELRDTISKLIIERDIYQRASQDGDNRIDELEAENKRLRDGIKKWANNNITSEEDKELYALIDNPSHER